MFCVRRGGGDFDKMEGKCLTECRCEKKWNTRWMSSFERRMEVEEIGRLVSLSGMRREAKSVSRCVVNFDSR